MFLNEIRKNPLLNPKISIYQELEKYLDDNVFVQFSDIPKLGINPRYSYGQTPFGIYGWPIGLFLELLEEGLEKKLTFSERKYILIFKYIGKNVLELNSINDNSKSIEILDSIKSKYDKYLSDREKNQYEYIRYSEEKGIVIYELARILATNEKISNSKEKSGLLWNHILRRCGYDAVIDDLTLNESQIYSDEPPQFVSLSKNNLELLKILNNNVDEKPIIINNKNWRILLKTIPNERLRKIIYGPIKKSWEDKEKIIPVLSLLNSNIKLIENYDDDLSFNTMTNLFLILGRKPEFIVKFPNILNFLFNNIEFNAKRIQFFLSSFGMLPPEYQEKFFEIYKDSMVEVSKYVNIGHPISEYLRRHTRKIYD